MGNKLLIYFCLKQKSLVFIAPLKLPLTFEQNINTVLIFFIPANLAILYIDIF
nr:MAG TPA: hypothetical protein [Caudoviricetes sp.]